MMRKIKNKKISLIILSIIFLILVSVFLYNFLYKKRNSGPVTLQPIVNLPVDQSIVSSQSQSQSQPLTEEKKIIAAAENFLRGYGNYQLGDFFNIESLYSQMTKRYKNEMSLWIIDQRQKYVLEPKRYITFTISILKSSVISLESNQAELKIKTKRTEIKGAAISGEGTIIWVDEFGNKPKREIPRQEFSQDARVKLIKENGQWKIDKVEFQ